MNKEIFPNGLNVLYEKSNNKIPISALQVYCKLGSVHEPDDLRGVSHAMEHMCFKGTPLHPTANSIFNVSIGSEFNAYTNKILTCYYMKCLDENIPQCIDILSDITFHSFFHKNDYEKEINVVKEENIKNADDLETIANEELETLMFKGTPFEYSIDTLDYHQSAQSLPLKKVVEYYKEHYIPVNIVVSIYSSVPFDTVRACLKKSFFYREKSPRDSRPLTYPRITPRPSTQTQYKLVNKPETITTYISLGFLTCSYSSDEQYYLDLFSTILAGNMDSYIFTLLRDKNGLTYTSDTDTNYFHSTGSFAVYAEEDQTKIIHNGSRKGVLPLLIDVFRHFRKNGITAKQLTNAKKIIHENRIRDLQDINTKAEHNAFECILQEGRESIPYDSLFDVKYKNITIENVNRVIHKYFTASNMSVCLVGSHLPSLETVKKICHYN
jgi:predicted Zn-dependent peptidase